MSVLLLAARDLVPFHRRVHCFLGLHVVHRPPSLTTPPQWRTPLLRGAVRCAVAGAGHPRRAELAIIACVAVALASAMPMIGALVAAPRAWVSLFTTDQAVVAEVLRCMPYLLAAFVGDRCGGSLLSCSNALLCDVVRCNVAATGAATQHKRRLQIRTEPATSRLSRPCLPFVASREASSSSVPCKALHCGT